jgi:exodeoxyribonuclease VII large subunit
MEENGSVTAKTIIYTPRSISTEVRRVIDSSATLNSNQAIYIRGVVCDYGFKKHAYFSLQQEAMTDAGVRTMFVPTLKCIMYGERTTEAMKAVLAKGGLVTVKGLLCVYAPKSNYQCNVYTITPVTQQDAPSQRDDTRAQARAEHLFEHPCRALPPWVCSVAVLTSEHGDAYHDFASQCRGTPIRVTLIPVAVQGTQCVPDHVRVLRALEADTSASYDVVLLTRGGGSATDLESYDALALLRAVHRFRQATSTVVLSAIGHSNDTPLLNDAADMACITPTAAAKHLTSAYEHWRVVLAQRNASQLRAAKDATQRLASVCTKYKTQFDAPSVWTMRELKLHDAFASRVQQYLERDEKEWTRTEKRLRGSPLYALYSIPGMALVTSTDTDEPYRGTSPTPSKLTIQFMSRCITVKPTTESESETETETENGHPPYIPPHLYDAVEKFVARQVRQTNARVTRKQRLET